MTFCVGISVRDGLVALADTQIVGGEEASNKAKLSVLEHDGHPIFVMTSGLRSIRDKAMLRLEDRLHALATPRRRMHQVVTDFGDQVKVVREEDGPALERSGYRFNSHAIIGGCLPDDEGPMLFLVYPEGNWINATRDAPSFVIGRSSYGKPILDRLLQADTPLPQAVALAYLAFDATRASVVDVDFPIDVVVLADGGFQRRRFDREELDEAHGFWHEQLRSALDHFPMGWSAPLWRKAAAPR